MSGFIGRTMLVMALFVSACQVKPPALPVPVISEATQVVPTPTSTPEPHQLTICLSQEPLSLFLYADASRSARHVRQAIYDGPIDLLGYAPVPVILEKIPSLVDGSAAFEAIEVQPGDLVIDANGNLSNLKDGLLVLPSGCTEPGCAQIYQADQAILMDQLIVRFTLLDGLTWSDGRPLTADDSVYSFEVAGSLEPPARADLLMRTVSYRALDDRTVEWRGLPGLRDPRYAENYFSPLPRHVWGDIPVTDLASVDTSSRQPLGWGAYIIEDWQAGQEIRLGRNPRYFRQAEGKPRFDYLIYRFHVDRQEALQALQAGECDLLDEGFTLENDQDGLIALQEAGKLQILVQTNQGWEVMVFNLAPQVDEGLGFNLFSSMEIRQATALCIDRQKIVEELFAGLAEVPNSYGLPGHPLTSPDIIEYTFDPQKGAEMLQALGWLDEDLDPATPRTALGVAGIPDGTRLSFKFATSDEREKQRVADLLQTSLATCGIEMQSESLPLDVLYAPGPEGIVFGKKFVAAQVGWAVGREPSCQLYLSQEIPGHYPQASKGWGGANFAEYSDQDFDFACAQALNSLPDEVFHLTAHYQAQAIFAQDLPALPLYTRFQLAAASPELCGLIPDPSTTSILWNIESLGMGTGCK